MTPRFPSTQPTDRYQHNPMIHKSRTPEPSASAWRRSFSVAEMRPLIVCRGPIRKEAMDVFTEMGMAHCGILLSEKDSIVFSNALAPELRQIRDPERVHRVPDYSGASKEERVERIEQIIRIAQDNDYDSIFAGYGFMAEDEDFVRCIEQAGLTFIGPSSDTVRRAGRKDEAKRTALAVGVSITPGVDDVTSRLLLAKYPDAASLRRAARKHGLSLPEPSEGAPQDLQELARAVLEASYEAQCDLFTLDELLEQIRREVEHLFQQDPKHRIRLKAIGGGGGKGQRILDAPIHLSGSDADDSIRQAAARAPEKAREILNEVKATGPGENKNILIERNIESTRHNEIQLIGNGEWCLALGGRDCSVQMHEQKLLEVSITREGLTAAIAAAKREGQTARVKSLRQELKSLGEMEEEAERFGQAVELDSVSTFENIVEGRHHYFMEMNTRIQVEHRVTELCYALKFTNPDDPADSFVVDSLVETMVLLARHGKRLPKPQRVLRMGAAVEARLNATDSALQPHAGGVIEYWSDPVDGEIRDDQGISLKNPDTGQFMRYRVAGAYDSNIALLITYGSDRLDSFFRLSEILRRKKLRGSDLATNLEFHYGLVQWFLGQDVYAKPTTGFVVPYLTLLGQLQQEALQVDIDHGFEWLKRRLERRAKTQLGADSTDCASLIKTQNSVIDQKRTLLARPLERLLGSPHCLSGWLMRHKDAFKLSARGLQWVQNPLLVLKDTYDFLNMDARPHAPAAEIIWNHDDALLTSGLDFYRQLAELAGHDLPNMPFPELDDLLRAPSPPMHLDSMLWAEIRRAHAGHQMGLELLGILPLLAKKVRFFEMKVKADLTIAIPQCLRDPQVQAEMKKVLVPPPQAAANEIAALMGGMFYARESPDLPPFVAQGDHFEQGDPLYIIEVMKMFNKVYAPFSGTIDEILLASPDGSVVSKGQPLFRVTPDEVPRPPEDPAEVQARRQKTTEHILKMLR